MKNLAEGTARARREDLGKARGRREDLESKISNRRLTRRGGVTKGVRAGMTRSRHHDRQGPQTFLLSPSQRNLNDPLLSSQLLLQIPV
jgi:hypothetical protein